MPIHQVISGASIRISPKKIKDGMLKIVHNSFGHSSQCKPVDSQPHEDGFNQDQPASKRKKYVCPVNYSFLNFLIIQR